MSRANPLEDRESVAAEPLRIVDQEVWAKAQALKAASAQMSSAAKRRPLHLLSGLLRCGSCGSGMSVHDRNHGRVRIRCSTVRESGTCENRSLISLDQVEAAVLGGMRTQLADPTLIKAYAKAYNDERQRLAGDLIRTRARTEARLGVAQCELDRAIHALIKGRLGEDEADQLLPTLRAERDRLRVELEATEAPPNLITLHPTAMNRYQITIDSLAATIADHSRAEDDRGDLARDFRALVHSVVVTRASGTSDVHVEVKGRLAALIGGTPFPEKVG